MKLKTCEGPRHEVILKWKNTKMVTNYYSSMTEVRSFKLTNSLSHQQKATVAFITTPVKFWEKSYLRTPLAKEHLVNKMEIFWHKVKTPNLSTDLEIITADALQQNLYFVYIWLSLNIKPPNFSFPN